MKSLQALRTQNISSVPNYLAGLFICAYNLKNGIFAVGPDLLLLPSL